MGRDKIPSAPTIYSSQDLTSQDLPTAVDTVKLQEDQVLITISRPLTPRGVQLNAVAKPSKVGATTAALIKLARELKANSLIQHYIEDALNT
jgi:hypothetical protein